MMNLKQFIQDRITQLEQRRFMIPRYIEREGQFLGKKDFSMGDIPKIEQEIEECKAALKGIEQWKTNTKQIK
jgi:hypothetical protein